MLNVYYQIETGVAGYMDGIWVTEKSFYDKNKHIQDYKDSNYRKIEKAIESLGHIGVMESFHKILDIKSFDEQHFVNEMKTLGFNMIPYKF